MHAKPSEQYSTQKSSILLQVEQFKDYSPGKLKRLAHAAEFVTLSARQASFRQGDLAIHLYVLVKGNIVTYQYFDLKVPYTKQSTIRIKHECDLRRDNQYHTQTKLFKRLNKIVDNRLETPQSQKKLLKRIEIYEAFGIEGVINHADTQHRKYEAVALCQCVCLRIHKSVFQQLESFQENNENSSFMLTQTQRRVTFAKMMDLHIRQLDSIMTRPPISLSTRHRPRLTKSLHFLNKLYKSKH